MKFGRTAKSDRVLSKAHQVNRYVIDYMLRLKEMPEQLPDYHRNGDENEAILYTDKAWFLWAQTAGDVGWLVEFKHEMMNKK